MSTMVKQGVICEACGFTAKTAQGLASHCLIKHQLAPRVAERQAELEAQLQGEAVLGGGR